MQSMRDWFYTCNIYLFLSFFLQREFVMIILSETYSNLVPGLLMRLTYSFWTFPVVFPASLLCFGSYTMEIYPHPKPARKSMAGPSVYKNILSCHHCCVLVTNAYNILQSKCVILTSLGFAKAFWRFPKHNHTSNTTENVWASQYITLKLCYLVLLLGFL